jgi:predicted GNAT superfamily acetyltransferase
MTEIIIRAATAADFPAILKLNDAEVQHTSAMNLARLGFLDGIACYHKVAIADGQVAAFLLAMGAGAPYQNDNYNWFATRCGSFIYVDRVVVTAGCAGRGIGSRLYADLFAHARAQGIKTITCEYNIQPPNPASQAFHDKYGFTELGTQWVANGTKQVSLQAAEI